MSFFNDVGNRVLDILEDRIWYIAAIVLMIIPVGISLQPFIREFEKTTFIFFGKTKGEEVLSITPTLLSTLFAICLHGILLARGVGKYFETGFTILLFVFNVLFTASFITIFISNETYQIPIINQPISSQTLMMVAILLSLISIRAIAGFIWIVLAVLAMFRVAAINEAMGLIGVLYVMFACVSLGIQTFKLKLLEIDRNELMYEFKGAGDRVLGDIKASASLGQEKTKRISNKVLNQISEDMNVTEIIEKDKATEVEK